MIKAADLILVSRMDSTSSMEKTADALLKPARVLFGGKRIYVLDQRTMHVDRERIGSDSTQKWVQIAGKIVCVIALPLTLLGFILKLSCRKDLSMKQFYATTFDRLSICDQALSEMIRHVYSTKNYVKDNTKKDGNLYFTPLNLFECGCETHGKFHRFHSERRSHLENAYVQKLLNTVQDKNQKVTLLSLGSGGMMSDFITLEKLILAGFRNISIDCVDNDPNCKNDERKMRIEEFFRKYPACQINVNCYESIKDVPLDHTYNAAMAMDYNYGIGAGLAYYIDFLESYRRLAPNGFMAWGSSDTDMIFRFDQKPEYVFRIKDAKPQIEDMVRYLPNEENISVLIDLHEINTMDQLLILKLACATAERNFNRITLTFVDNLNRLHMYQDKLLECLKILFKEAVIEIKQGRSDLQHDMFWGDFPNLPSQKNAHEQSMNMLKANAPAYINKQGKIFRVNQGNKIPKGIVVNF